MQRLSKVSCQRLLVIVLLPVAMALIAAWWHPVSLSAPEGQVTIREVVSDEELLWVDVRSESE